MPNNFVRFVGLVGAVLLSTFTLSTPAVAADPTGLSPSSTELTALPLTDGARTDVRNVTITFTPTGGDSSYECTTDESLPPGLSLSAACVLSGVTDTLGSYTFTIDVEDTNNSNSIVYSEEYTIVIEAVSLQNEYLRFGIGTNHSISPVGALQQPWYKSPVDSTWYPLIYSESSGYSVDLALGYGTGNESNFWNGNTQVFDITDDFDDYFDNLDTLSVVGWTVDKTGFTETSTSSGVSIGYGTLVTETSFRSLQGVEFAVKNTYLLGQSASFVKATTSVKQLTGSDWQNSYLWVGTRDDYVGTDDSPDKNKGNIGSGGFTATSAKSEIANAIQTTSDAEGALFYSTATGANSMVDDCCAWESAFELDPTESEIQQLNNDGSYGVAIPLGTLASGSYSTGSEWYFAGGPIDSLATVAQQVAQSSGAAPATPPPYTGPIIQDVGNDSRAGAFTVSSSQQITVSGDRLSTVTKAFIDGKECEVVSTANDELVIITPAGLSAGVYDLVIYSSIGNLTYLDAVRVTAASVAAENYGEQKAWTQRISDTQAKIYVKYPVVGERVRIGVQTGGSGSYETIYVKTLDSESHPDLTVNANGSYIVRTIDLEDINRIRITVGDDRLVQVRYNR